MASSRQSWYWSESSTDDTYTALAHCPSARGGYNDSVKFHFCKICSGTQKEGRELLTELSKMETASHDCRMCYFLLQAYRQCLPSDDQGSHLYVIWDKNKAEAMLESPKNHAVESVTIGMKSSLALILPIIQSRSLVFAIPDSAYNKCSRRVRFDYRIRCSLFETML